MTNNDNFGPNIFEKALTPLVMNEIKKGFSTAPFDNNTVLIKVGQRWNMPENLLFEICGGVPEEYDGTVIIKDIKEQIDNNRSEILCSVSLGDNDYYDCRIPERIFNNPDVFLVTSTKEIPIGSVWTITKEKANKYCDICCKKCSAEKQAVGLSGLYGEFEVIATTIEPRPQDIPLDHNYLLRSPYRKIDLIHTIMCFSYWVKKEFFDYAEPVVKKEPTMPELKVGQFWRVPETLFSFYGSKILVDYTGYVRILRVDTDIDEVEYVLIGRGNTAKAVSCFFKSKAVELLPVAFKIGQVLAITNPQTLLMQYIRVKDFRIEAGNPEYLIHFEDGVHDNRWIKEPDLQLLTKKLNKEVAQMPELKVGQIWKISRSILSGYVPEIEIPHGYQNKVGVLAINSNKTFIVETIGMNRKFILPNAIVSEAGVQLIQNSTLSLKEPTMPELKVGQIWMIDNQTLKDCDIGTFEKSGQTNKTYVRIEAIVNKYYIGVLLQNPLTLRWTGGCVLIPQDVFINKTIATLLPEEKPDTSPKQTTKNPGIYIYPDSDKNKQAVDKQLREKNIAKYDGWFVPAAAARTAKDGMILTVVEKSILKRFVVAGSTVDLDNEVEVKQVRTHEITLTLPNEEFTLPPPDKRFWKKESDYIFDRLASPFYVKSFNVEKDVITFTLNDNKTILSFYDFSQRLMAKEYAERFVREKAIVTKTTSWIGYRVIGEIPPEQYEKKWEFI